MNRLTARHEMTTGQGLLASGWRMDWRERGRDVNPYGEGDVAGVSIDD